MVIAKIKAWLAALGLLGGAVAVAYLSGKRSGKADAKLKEAEDALDGHVLRNEVENRIARERDARERLLDEWSE